VHPNLPLSPLVPFSSYDFAFSASQTTYQTTKTSELILEKICSISKAAGICKFGPSLRVTYLTDRLQVKNPLIVISKEVEDAVINGKPVVALETAIVTHGMPFPANLKTARSVESCVRESDAIPASIGSKSLGATLFQL
jgi:hypothetical protein